MQSELNILKRKAIGLGLCSQYIEKWNDATDKKALADIGLDAKGADFLCDSCSNGWGLSVEYLRRMFGDYINGKYQRNKGGYTSELYVGYTGRIEQRSTMTLLIGCACTIHIPKNSLCEVYLSGASHVDIINEGQCTVLVYGKECSYNNSGNAVHRKYIDNAEPHINH